MVLSREDSVEIQVDFRSLGEWKSWRAKNRDSFALWRDLIVERVRRAGVNEPISGKVHSAAEIKIDLANLYETISVGQLNSRKRAGLFALELARKSSGRERAAKAKILGAEGLTRAALIMRGAYSYYVGAEYLPTQHERQKHFPIPHLDLMNADFPSEFFDLFYSADVLDLVPDLNRALSEIYRLLNDGGVMVSTFPFNREEEETKVCAVVNIDGAIWHLTPPSYHRNPVRPEEGSLVFATPAWDILSRCRDAGFVDAKMTLYASSTYGVANSSNLGVLVLSALKAARSEDPVAQRFSAIRNYAYVGPALSAVVALVALPRSGTTLLSAMLSVHSRVNSVYEPWNTSKKKTIPSPVSLMDFFKVFPTDMGGKDVLLVKETATELRYLKEISAFLDTVNAPFDRSLIFLIRNPWHIFLSEVEARKKWWGEADLALTPDLFDRWAQRTLHGLQFMKSMVRRFGGIGVSYEALVSDPEPVVRRLMRDLSLPFEAAQLNYEQYVQKGAVRGDVGLATDPKPVSDNSVANRAREHASLADEIKGSQFAARIELVATLFAEAAEAGVFRSGSPAMAKLLTGLDGLQT